MLGVLIVSRFCCCYGQRHRGQRAYCKGQAFRRHSEGNIPQNVVTLLLHHDAGPDSGLIEGSESPECPPIRPRDKSLNCRGEETAGLSAQLD